MVLEEDAISRNCGGFKFLLNYSKNEGIAHLESTTRSAKCAGVGGVAEDDSCKVSFPGRDILETHEMNVRMTASGPELE
jgi:hypothetical protein